MDTHHVVILGAGYAGMMCAVRLARRTRRLGVRITLVNPSELFVERLRLHQVAGGQTLPGHRVTDVLAGTGVTFVRGRATALDPGARRVTVDDGRELAYDTLVYALGSATDTARVPGVAEHALVLDRPADLTARLDALPAGSTLVVCGGGLTGIEAATEIAEGRPGLRVTLVTTRAPGATMNARARAHLTRALDRLGVTVRVGQVAKVLPDAVELDGGELLHADACLWTAGVRVPPLAADAGVDADANGRIVVDATLRSVSHPEIHAVGDAAAVRQAWGTIHGTCQSGIPTGAYTGDAIARRLRGKAVKPFRFGYFHQPLSLGRRDAVIQFTRADDSARRWCLTGRAAVLYKESVSASPLKLYALSKHVHINPQLSKGGRATRG
ncbi:NAD(P)/FAD-dependent oxidoreductase [Actinomadura kijaniata]|uniref:NAD(P)/FAD-dependent oxidoreductase n=1 Tax=Actinomadura kijaniata TaxID=46161 RepID=UPI003F1DFFC5